MAWLTDTDAPGAGRGSITCPSPTALSPYARRGRLAARKSIPGRCRVAAWSAAVLRSQRSRLSPSSRLPCPPGSREIVLSMRSNLPKLVLVKVRDLGVPLQHEAAGAETVDHHPATVDIRLREDLPRSQGFRSLDDPLADLDTVDVPERPAVPPRDGPACIRMEARALGRAWTRLLAVHLAWPVAHEG